MGRLCSIFSARRSVKLSKPDSARELATGAWRYAQAARARAQQADNQRVTEKYDWLVRYMRQRLPNWGVAVDNAGAV